MGALSVMVTTHSHISVHNNQLVIKGDSGNRIIPIEDISCLLIDSLRCTITTTTINELSSNGVAIFLCGKKHLPTTITTPFAVHSKGFYRLKLQLTASLPTKKRIWQSIIMQKIYNQAVCLNLCGQESEAMKLFNMSQAVLSGDSSNLEASAARIYFKALFGSTFLRGKDDRINAALNYGYTIVRGSLARYLTAGGYYPSLGLFHHSVANNFNLADDVIEPIRPVVDYLVYRTMERAGELSRDDRIILFNVLNTNVLANGQQVSLDFAMQNIPSHLEQAYLSKTHQFPELTLMPNMFAYEESAV